MLKDRLTSKLIFASCIGSFCNGGLLLAMVIFYSLDVEVKCRTLRRFLILNPSLSCYFIVRLSTTDWDSIPSGMASLSQHSHSRASCFRHANLSPHRSDRQHNSVRSLQQVYLFEKVLHKMGVITMFQVSSLLLCLGSFLLPCTAFINWALGTHHNIVSLKTQE